MARKHKSVSTSSKAGVETTPRASPESEARFPPHLSPIIQCKKSVLDHAKIEFYGAVIISGIEAVVPMSGLTRSLVLLFVFGPLVDIAWRSPWSHAWKTASKVLATVLLTAIYSAIATTLIAREHQAAALAIKNYLNSGRAEWLFRWLYFLGGCVVAYLATKLFSLLRGYMRGRRAQKLAVRQRFRETRRGWLDYRLESEESSKRLHFLIARMARVVKGMAVVLTHGSWFIGKEDKEAPVVRARATASLLAVLLDKCSARLEPDLKELEATANLFIESTEGHLKALQITTKQDYMQLAALHEYFESQL